MAPACRLRMLPEGRQHTAPEGLDPFTHTLTTASQGRRRHGYSVWRRDRPSLGPCHETHHLPCHRTERKNNIIIIILAAIFLTDSVGGRHVSLFPGPRRPEPVPSHPYPRVPSPLPRDNQVAAIKGIVKTIAALSLGRWASRV